MQFMKTHKIWTKVEYWTAIKNTAPNWSYAKYLKGLDLKFDELRFLIHSNYLSPVSVCIETLKESRVFKSFTKFHLVAISHNDTLLQRWLDNGTVL